MNIIKALCSVTIFSILFDLDVNHAEMVRRQGCPICGGPLHYGRYKRNPVGYFLDLPEEYLIRQGLCCGHCRSRTLPPSCLFMGRKRAFRCAVLIFLTLRHNREKPAIELSEILGIHVRTLRRWVAHFRDEFPSSDVWQRLRGFVSPKVGDDQLPGSLVVHFIDQTRNIVAGIVSCIQFMVSGEEVVIK